MNSLFELSSALSAGRLDSSLTELYGPRALEQQRARYGLLIKKMVQTFPEELGMFVSAPGRTELGGNHTDHNGGHVLAAAVDLDCVALVMPTKESEIIIGSEEYPETIRVGLDTLRPREEEKNSPEALVRGVAACFQEQTDRLGGFRAQLSATCRPGTGLSSSAAFSVLTGGILNYLHGGRKLSAERLAQMARVAENDYFGKPCGLMDQLASSVGTTLSIDFYDHQNPVIQRISIPASASGYSLLVVDTGGSHADLTSEYAAVVEEMQLASRVLGQSSASGIELAEVIAELPRIRHGAGDRAALRLIHFIQENQRAIAQAEALSRGNFTKYLELVGESGRSSAMLLQNCASTSATREQGILLGLALTRMFCPGAIARVHGGGFAGTIQVYIPDREVMEYREKMEEVFGRGSVIPLLIGRPGLIGVACSGLVRTSTECGVGEFRSM